MINTYIIIWFSVRHQTFFSKQPPRTISLAVLMSWDCFFLASSNTDYEVLKDLFSTPSLGALSVLELSSRTATATWMDFSKFLPGGTRYKRHAHIASSSISNIIRLFWITGNERKTTI